MDLLVKNIGQLMGVLPEGTDRLRGTEMNRVESISDAWLLVRDGRIADFGEMGACPEADDSLDIYDAEGGIVIPAFCDSHTHLVWAGDRTGEFIDKINGLSYEEIAERGGGILNSADRLNRTSEDELFESAHRRLRQMMAMGTGAVEIKSGYALTKEGEAKMLRVIARLREAEPDVIVRSTFLGAHAVGRAFAGRQGKYVDYLIAEMLPSVAELSDFVDVFCDRGFFTTEETARILEASAKYGLRPKIHANELAVSGGVQVGVAHGALSVDHLERIGSEETALLAASETVATMLPGASFFLGMPYGPAREAITAGCTLALASDYNPGSSPSGSMPFVMSLASIKMKLLPEQALNAVTINGAAAMDVADEIGSFTKGKRGSFTVYKPHVTSLAYAVEAYTEPTIAAVFLKGRKVGG